MCECVYVDILPVYGFIIQMTFSDRTQLLTALTQRAPEFTARY